MRGQIISAGAMELFKVFSTNQYTLILAEISGFNGAMISYQTLNEPPDRDAALHSPGK